MITFEFDPTPSRKVNVPQTSRDAHESIKEHKADTYDIIVKALEEIKIGATSEQISIHTGIKHERIWKRMSELVDSNVLFNTGIKRKTTSGRGSMVRQLTRLKN